MKIIFTATTMVAEPIASSVTRIAVEYAPRICSDREEGEDVVLVGGVVEDSRKLGTAYMERKVAGATDVHVFG